MSTGRWSCIARRDAAFGPVAVYSHSLGCSVTRGYVDRGTACPVLQGGYVFGDYCSGRIWDLTADGPARQSPRLLLNSGRTISSFGQGGDGALYLTEHSSGEVYRLVAVARLRCFSGRNNARHFRAPMVFQSEQRRIFAAAWRDLLHPMT